MSILLDTHAFLWWVTADPRLSAAAKTAIDDPSTRRCVSSVTAFEIANKFRIGKLEMAGEIIESFDAVLGDAGFEKLAVTSSHALLAGQIPSGHKDPFDRILAAQAKLENLAMLTIDPAFDTFGIQRLW
ncbi:MAG: type II toxin-antitoxin system VapC family toxin [Rhizobium sp.]|nr:type II toxin-antitoxin system VapC family toxin [Rhizobium sp.]